MNFVRALSWSLVLLLASTATFSCYVTPAHASAEIIGVSSFFSFYDDIITFCNESYNLQYFNIATRTLVKTDYRNVPVFHSFYENSVAHLVWLSQGSMEYYDISTGSTQMINMSGFPDIISAFDLVIWAYYWPVRPISTYGNITAFTESTAGTCYINRSSGNWLSIEPTAKEGVSVYQDIIAFSNGTIYYYNLTSGTTVSTGQTGFAPSVYGNLIAFTNDGSIKYYNITNGQTTFVASGWCPSIYENTIVFSTKETDAGTDLNGDGDLTDEVIRYYDIGRGIVVNTREVGTGPSIYGGTIVFYAKEQWLDRDVNKDGDKGDWVIMLLSHDIATIGIIPSSTSVTLGQSVIINVTVENQGLFTETFNVDVFLSVYANTTFLGNQTVASLAPGATKTLTFFWNTAGFLTGPYKITAIAQRVPGEIDTSDNDCTYGMVQVQTGNMHTLFVFNYPAWSILLPFTINKTRNVSPWSGGLNEGVYVVTMLDTIADNGIIYEFKNWEDNTTSPARTINLTTDKNIIAYYKASRTLSPIIYASPIVTTAENDTDFEIKIKIVNVTNLYTWEFKLYYDTRFMDAITATEGSFLKSGGATTFQIKELNDAYNATHGRVWLNCSLTGPSSGVKGNGTLATILFRATAIGNSLLVLSETKLSDSFSTSIPHRPLQGVGLIRVKMPADVNNDGIVDIFDLVLVSVSLGTKKGEPPNPPSHDGFNPHADIVQDNIIDIFDLVMVGAHLGEKDP